MVPLGEVIAPAGFKAGADTNHPVFSVTKHAGFVPSAEYFKKQVFSRELNGYKRVTQGDFAYATIHLDEGSIGIAPADGLISPMYTVFRPVETLVDSDYLLRFMKSPFAIAQYPRFGKGSVQRRKSISLDALCRLMVPLPPLDEQRRVAAILDHSSGLVAKRGAVVIQLGELVRSTFDGMFGGLRTCSKLSDGCLRITDGTHQSPEWTDAGVPFLFITNISSGEINFETKKFISVETWQELTRRAPIEVGDVLYSTVGVTYGIPAVVRSNERFAFQRHIAHIKPDRDALHPDFLAAMLSSPLVKRQADRVARGAAQPTVNLADIKEFDVIIPPYEKQLEFVRRIDAIRDTRLKVTSALQAQAMLFEGLRAQAFSGQL